MNRIDVRFFKDNCIKFIISCLYRMRLVVFSKNHFLNVLSSWLRIKKFFNLHHCLAFPFQKMTTLRKKRKLAAVASETQEEYPENGQSRITSVPRINEDYITQVSEEIQGRVTKKLSQEFNRTESRIFGALSKFLLNPQVGHNPEPFTEHPGTQAWKTRNQTKIVPRMILVLK